MRRVGLACLAGTLCRAVSHQERFRHGGQSPSSPTSGEESTGSSTAESGQPASGKSLVLDDDSNMTAWVGRFVERAVADGRQSPVAAAYFQDMLKDKPEFEECLREAKRLTGGQDPSHFTPYQQGLFADRLGQYVSGVASRKLMEVQQEEQQGKNFSKDGTPTGEQYWYEAGTTLASPGVPGYVKDEIFHEMQRDRRPGSPAFEEPEEAKSMAEKDEGFAAHVRRQKQMLFSGADFDAVPPR